MLTEVIKELGERKQMQRLAVCECLICGASFECSPSDDIWEWVKTPEVESFKALHLGHGFANAVGIRLVEVEVLT